MKLILTIFLTYIFLSKSDCDDLVCCPSVCNVCGACTNSSDDDLCCATNILESNLSCTDYSPPCISNATVDDTSWDQFLTFITNIPNIIFLGICFIIMVSMCYACTCFGNKKPPIPYSDITWTEGESWIKID